MKPYNPIITAFATLTVLLTAGCSSVRHASAQTDNRLYLTETNNSETIDAYREIHRRLRPLERPQVRYSIEEALVEGDSCLVILRITVPDKSIGKRERYHADIGLSTAEGVLMFPELTFDNDSGLSDDDGGDSDDTQPDEENISTSLEIEAHGGRPAYAYMCFRFLHHPSMDGNGALISVYPRLETRRYIYVFHPEEMPVRWLQNTCLWRQRQNLPQFILLDSLPDPDDSPDPFEPQF